MYRGGQKRVKEIKTKEQKNAETLGALYIYIYQYSMQQVEFTYSTEREHNLEEISFFCDANKSVKKYRDTLVLKTDYPVTLKGRELLMSKDSLFFR